MSILLDNRKGSKDLYPYLVKSKIPTELCVLNSGDVCFRGIIDPSNKRKTIGIEFKAIEDVVNSRSTGRLPASQMKKMYEDYDQRWLLIYQRYKIDRDGNLEVLAYKVSKKGDKSYYWRLVYIDGKRPANLAYLESFLISVQDYGFRIKFVESIEFASYWISCLYHKRQKSFEDQHKCMEAFDTSGDVTFKNPDEKENYYIPVFLDKKTEVRAKMLTQIPGMGYARALSVAKYFKKSIEDDLGKVELSQEGKLGLAGAFQSSIEELAEIEVGRSGKKSRRLGKVIAKQVYDILR